MNEKNIITEKSLKIKLLLYALLSALAFFYLVLPQSAGISVPVFVLMQFLCLWFIVKKKSRLWFFIPIFMLSLNFFISGSGIWRPWNIVVSALLYAAMFTDLRLKNAGGSFLAKIFKRAAIPIRYFALPVSWAISLNEGKAPLIKRILKAFAIAVPCAVVLTAVLSSADMVFSRGLGNLFAALLRSLNFNLIFKGILAVIAGLYLFGVVCSAFIEPVFHSLSKPEKHTDLLVVNILISCMLIIYTIFVVIQFRYLFAGAALPYGLSYTEYARKGFFELLALSGVNIAMILFSIGRSNEKSPAANFAKGLSCYLCLVTFVLLASSFRRMMLYCNYDGLTRLRFFVLGFLIFEAVGLAATLLYIFKPKFNIIMVYSIIALLYYLLLNLIPTDSFVARSQVDMYLSGQRTEIDYALSLSSDAAAELARLAEDEKQCPMVREYFLRLSEAEELPERWQRYNLSKIKAMEIFEDMQPPL